MNDPKNRQLMPVLLPRNEEEQAALLVAFAQARTYFASANPDKFKSPENHIAFLREGPILNLVRESSAPDPEKDKEAFQARSDINDKDRIRGFPYKNFRVWQRQQNGEKTLIADWEDTGAGNHILGNHILEVKVLERLKPYFSSTLNQRALNGCLGQYLVGALSFYLPNASWINVLGGHLGFAPKTELEIVCSGQNQFQLVFTQLGFKKSQKAESEEYSNNTFSITLSLTFNSAEAEMPSEVTLSKIILTPFSHELSKAIDAEKVLQKKLSNISFIAKKLSDSTYCHVITSLIFLEKINLNKVLRKAKPQQKINLLKNIFTRQEFSEWFGELPEPDQDNLLEMARVLPLSEKIKIYMQQPDNKVKKAFAENIGWNATVDDINELSDEALRKVVFLDRDPQHKILKKIIDDAHRPIEAYNFFERRFPRLFQKKRKVNADIIEKKYALRLLLSTPLSQNSTSEEAFAYLTNKDNAKTFAEAFLSNATLLEKLKLYQSANDLLKLAIAEPIKNSEEFSTFSVSDLLQAGATAKELTTFAKLQSGESSEVALNETTEAIIKGAGKQIKPLNFFERNFPRIFSRKARENEKIEVQQLALSSLLSSDKTLAPKVQEKIDSLETPWSEKFTFVDALPKSVDYIEQLKSQAKIFFDQALPKEEGFIANAETYTKLAKMIPVGFQDMSVDDIKEGNTAAGIRKFFLGQYTFLCLPLDALPKEEDFANDATIQACSEMITKRIQQIKALLGTLVFIATLENSTPTSKRQIFDLALQNETRRSDLANLALLPHDPYGVRAYFAGKDTFNIPAPKFELPPFVRQKTPVAEEEMQPVVAAPASAVVTTLTVPSSHAVFDDGSVTITVPAATLASSPAKILVGLSSPAKPVTKATLAEILQKTKTPIKGNTAPELTGTAEKMKEELSSVQLNRSSDGSRSSHESSPRDQNEEQSRPTARRMLAYGSGSE